MKELKSIIKKVLEEQCNLRVFDLKSKQQFGEEILTVRVHLNDLRHCDFSDEEITEKLKTAGANCLCDHDKENKFRIKVWN